jgi:acetyltransferase-like isoleucine patch superfamily enzyme
LYLLGNNVWIGGNVIILKGTRIGDNSVISAGSVVSGRIPKNQVWGGNPARFIYSISNYS